MKKTVHDFIIGTIFLCVSVGIAAFIISGTVATRSDSLQSRITALEEQFIALKIQVEDFKIQAEDWESRVVLLPIEFKNNENFLDCNDDYDIFEGR